MSFSETVRFLVLTALISLIFVGLTVAAAVAWGDERHDSFDLARAEAARLHKPLVVHVGAAWCKPCKDLDRLYGPRLRETAIYLHLDADRDVQIIGRLPIVIRSYPTVIVWDVRPAVVPKVFIGVNHFRLWIEGRR